MRNIASLLAWHYIGLPYKWGGNDAMSGFDCSGLIVEILKSVGLLPRQFDTTAKGLMIMFRDKKVDSPYEGCLVFYGKIHATHIEYCINSKLTVGASGGGSDTVDLKTE